MDDPISVTVDGAGVVIVRGEVDAFTTGPLDAALRDALAREEGDVTVDLSAVTFMDSGGLNVFIRYYKTLAAQGRRLVLRDLQPSVARALEVAGLMTVFDVEAS